MLFLTLFGAGGAAAVVGGALALGLRHGIDWDHIAAIADITSTSASGMEGRDASLAVEPTLQLTDESHHTLAIALTGASVAGAAASHGGSVRSGPMEPPTTAAARLLRWQRGPLFLGTMYALGHGSMVVVLGLSAILFSRILPGWIDPIMERVVGLTLVLLAAYLFYSLYRFFRGGEDFRLRSRWMLVFSGIKAAHHRLVHRAQGANHSHAPSNTQQYGVRTAYGIGLIHGIGAETGTQVLVIGAAVGAGSKGMGVATLFAFVVGLLISNSIVTIMTTTGFVSAHRRRAVYVAVGFIAAVFSLVLGLLFLTESAGSLPDLDRYFRWIGGSS